jgi:hypothetical protein
VSSEQGTLKLVCPRCGIAMRAEVRGSHHWPKNSSPRKPAESYFAVCGNCEEPFLVEYYEDRSKLFESLAVKDVAEGKIGQGWQWHKLYPVEAISGAPEHLPDSVAEFYVEACGCLASGYPNAAGAMFRKTLEAATRADGVVSSLPKEERDAYSKAMLSRRLSKLKDHHIIPAPLFHLVETIKLEGNEAVHGMETYSAKEAEALKGFLDAFLNFVFTLPRKMADVRTAANGPASGATSSESGR